VLRTCPGCSKELGINVKKYCPHCGKDLRNWFMRHKIITFIGGFILLCILSNAGKDNANTNTSSNLSNTKVSNAVNVTKSPALEIDKNIKIIMDATSLNKQESEKVFNDIKSVGFKTISELKPALGTGVNDCKSFTGTCDGITTIVTIEKRKTYYIGSGSIDLYKDAKAVNNINDYVLKSDEEIKFKVDAEEYVKQCLKAPSTAKFPGHILEADKWSVGRKKDLVQVKSYVDSQNSFGAMIRSDFVVQFNYKSGNVICVIIDGRAVYGSPYTE
jgi:hypothetical protein